MTATPSLASSNPVLAIYILRLPQCTRCQGFNHTRKYCNVNPVCVKCAGPHLTHTCTKTRDTPATCTHCQQPHPANYRDLVTRLRSKSGQQPANNTHLPILGPPASAELCLSRKFLLPDLPHLTPQL